MSRILSSCNIIIYIFQPRCLYIWLRSNALQPEIPRNAKIKNIKEYQSGIRISVYFTQRAYTWWGSATLPEHVLDLQYCIYCMTIDKPIQVQLSSSTQSIILYVQNRQAPCANRCVGNIICALCDSTRK